MVEGLLRTPLNRRRMRGWDCLVVSTMLCAASTAPWAAPACLPFRTGTPPEQMPLANLEAAYRGCDSYIAHELPAVDELEYCTLVYETLKRRRFQGSTDRFVAWLRRQPKPAASFGCSRERAAQASPSVGGPVGGNPALSSPSTSRRRSSDSTYGEVASTQAPQATGTRPSSR